MSLRNYTSLELGTAQYEQNGFDIVQVDHIPVYVSGPLSFDYQIVYAKDGLDGTNILYKDIADGAEMKSSGEPYWIAIQNMGISVGATVMAETIGPKGNLTKHAFNTVNFANNAEYIDLGANDIVWGKFTGVSLWITSGSPFLATIRLIRGNDLSK